MTTERIARAADRIVAARRAGTRIDLGPDAPADFAEGFAVQEAAMAKLGGKTVGWKVMSVPQGPDIFAPIAMEVPAGGTWTVVGPEPAGMELEIAFRMARDVPAGASRAEVLEAVASAVVVFELCQSRLTDPSKQPRHIGIADCVSNSGICIGDAIAGWKSKDFKGVGGRLLVDGKVLKEGKSADPVAMLSLLPAALAKRGKRLEAGQTVITGSLVGMNWIEGAHALEGIIDGCGKVNMQLARG